MIVQKGISNTFSMLLFLGSSRVSLNGTPGRAFHQSPITVNSLAPRGFEWNFVEVVFKLILEVDGRSVSLVKLLWHECHWTFLIMNQPTLVHGMAWCLQAPSHYLSQCWPSSMVSLVHNGLSFTFYHRKHKNIFTFSHSSILEWQR